jgi:ornithine cyclodeaminase/alanine dehydrogenase-like protein (mu-crystallin family)
VLLINNDDVKTLLSMPMTLEALEEAYADMIQGEAVCRPRVDIQIPTTDSEKTYRWGTMEGGSTRGYFAIRMKSDILFENRYGDTKTLEKYCVSPGTFCGLILLFRVENGEPLAMINDGVLQHMRVGADSAIGVKHMARDNAQVVGMLGSGGMARSHIEAFCLVRKIRKLKVFSPTKAHREAYAEEMSLKYGIKTAAVDDPCEVYKDVDILCSCTDASIPVIKGKLIQRGVHVTSIGGRPDLETFQRVDRFLRLGNATAALGASSQPVDEFFRYITPKMGENIKQEHAYAKGIVRKVAQDKIVYLRQIFQGEKGRESSDQITYSERGNIQGAQFYSVAARVYEKAKKAGMGRDLPTEWFLQDIRD